MNSIKYFIFFLILLVSSQCSTDVKKVPKKYNCKDFELKVYKDPRFSLAEDSFKTGDYESSIITYKDLLQDSLAEDNILKAMLCRENLGLIYLKTKKIKEAQQEFEQVKKLNHEINNLRFKAFNIECFARLNKAKGKYEKSIELFKESTDIYLHCKQLYRLNSNLNHIAANYFYLKNLKQSRDYLIKALKLSKKIKSQENESLAIFYYGKILIEENKIKKAKDVFFQLLELDRELKNSYNIARDLSHIAQIYRLEKNYDKELHFYERAYAVLKNSSLPRRNPQLIDVIKRIIDIYQVLKDNVMKDFYQNELSEIYKNNNVKY